MKMKNLLVNLVSILYLYPLVILIHELGHALAIKLLGGKVTALHVGVGEKNIINKGVFKLKANPVGGYCEEKFEIIPTKMGLIFMYASGVMATSITGLILSIIVGFNPIEFAWNILTIQQPADILKTFLFLFFFDSLNLVPIKDKEGKKSDGYQILELIFNKKKEDLLA